MRVFHVQKVTGIGGSERYLLALLPELAQRGVQVKMCVLAAGDAERFIHPLVAAGVDTVILSAGPTPNPLLVRRLHREIRAFKPTLVHTHLIHADVYGQMAARLAGVPGISTAHGSNPFFARWPFRPAARRAGHLAARTICVSEHVARYITGLGLVEADRTRVIPLGMDAQGWMLDATERTKIRTGFGLQREHIAVGAVSRMVPYKGHDFLIEAFSQALADCPNLVLLLGGDGPLRADLEALSARLTPPGSVRFVGFQQDVRHLLNAVDVMAFPTLPGFGEGFGLAMLEAMAAGLPVVASDIDSIPEVVDEGRTGLLVQPGDRHALATAIIRLANDESLRDELGTAGRTRVEQVFSMSRMVDATLDLYREVARPAPT